MLWRHCQGFSDPLIITPATLQWGHQCTARGNLELIKFGFLFNPASNGERLEEEWIDSLCQHLVMQVTSTTEIQLL